MNEVAPDSDVLDQDRAAVGNSGAPELRLGAYDGPLDLLLELARAQKVDLAKVSIAAMAEQFAAAVDDEIRHGSTSLSRLGDWLVMASWLTMLRARLLVPANPAEAAVAEREAAALRRRLADRLFAQCLASWLERRQQLGRDVLQRGLGEPELAPAPAADVTELLRACLGLLRPSPASSTWAPAPVALWRLPDALEHVSQALIGAPQGKSLPELVPSSAVTGSATVQRKAAMASVFLAGLELARAGQAGLGQEQPFAMITLSPAITCTGDGSSA